MTGIIADGPSAAASEGNIVTRNSEDCARPSRRALMLGASGFAVWAATPARASLFESAVRAQRLPAALEALLRRMTVEEKAGQLSLMPMTRVSPDTFNPALPENSGNYQIDEIRTGRLGAVFGNVDPQTARSLQTVAVKHSRLGIPLLFGADVIHGFRTIFPVPLAEAASFDPALAERTARVAASEASSMGIDWTFAPMVDIARDARWGRGVEGAGEDVLLGREMAAARVRGFQGRSLADNDAVLACPKHFAAYGASEGGLDYSTVDVSERTLREVYLPPFKAAFEAGALSTMAAFVDIAGVPATANPWLLDQVLRREWRFNGIVVTDFTGDEELVAHGLARDARDAARLAFLAGVDMSMSSGLFIKYLPDLVAKGEVPMARLDQAVRRILSIKAKLGLFDDPFRRMDPDRAAVRLRTPANLAISREAACRSIVMVKNEGGLLPLPRAGKRIALIGPFAEGKGNLNGPWTVFGKDGEAVDLATGVRAAVSDAASVTVSAGSGIDTPLADGIAAAAAAAHAADIVLLAIGESQGMSGESTSRAETVLPAAQQALAEAVAATGKPIVIVLKNGRALALQGAVVAAPAILVTWFLGSETGNAIADILFGKECPSGRLPVSFPRSPGQVPFYYAHKSSGRPNTKPRLEMFKTHYTGIPNTALFPFGHGLTYGEIDYADLRLGSPVLARGGTLSIGAIITNRGTRAAVEIVQLYVQELAASVTRPVRELKAFRRVDLAPGEAKTVVFELGENDLAFLGRKMKLRTEPGLFRIWIAPSAEAEGTSGTFTLAAA